MATLESVIEDDDYNKDLERLMGVPVDLIKKIVDALFAEEATMEFLEMAFTDSKRIRKQLVEE